MVIHLRIALLSILFYTCIKPASAQKIIEPSYHRTIETVMILRALDDQDYIFSTRKPDFKGRPLLYEARQYFQPFKDHPAVQATHDLLIKMQDIGGVLFQGVLYAEELPSTKINYELSDPYWKDKKEELATYLKVIARFYREADVEGFFNKYKVLYEGALNETKSYLNNKLIEGMETYFGKKNEAYKLIIIPLSPFGMGFSVSTETIHYEILSPVTDVEWHDRPEKYKAFGYTGEGADEYYRDMVAHEFCHAFITHVLEQENIKAMIGQYDTLYTPMLDSAMQEQGYEGWWSFVNEHLVRLGEVRVTKAIGMKKEAAQMSNINVNIYKYVLLPEAEMLMEEYERNRALYPVIDDFIPVLISQFRQYSRPEIDKRIKAAQAGSVVITDY